MKPFLVLCAFILASLAIVPTADARRGGSCANGACAVSTANLTPAKFDPAKHPRDPVTGRFVPAPKAAAVESDDHRDYGRQPVRKAGRAVLRGAGRVLLAPVRLLRGRCG